MVSEMQGSSAGRGGSLLFVTWAGGGNVNPLIALGQQLAKRGHHIRVLAAPGLRSRIETNGFEFRPMRPVEEIAPGVSLAERRLALLRAAVEDCCAEVSLDRPDLAVVDFMMPEAVCAMEASEVPTIAFVHTLYSDVAIAPNTPMAMSGGLELTNALRRELGLEAIETLPSLLDRCARVLVVTSKTLDGAPASAPANVVFSGPLLERSDAVDEWQPPFKDFRPLVHISMGSVAPDQLALPIVQAALDGLANSDVNVLVTLPRAEDQPWSRSTPAGPEALRLPANAAAVWFTPHSRLLPHTAVFITHAGLGSVGAALTFGVPMVCTPIFLEQPENAARVAAVGAGLVLPTQAAPAMFAEAVERVLASSSYLVAARRIAAELADEGTRRLAVDTLEAMLRERKTRE